MVGVVGSCGPDPMDWQLVCIVVAANLAILSMGRAAGALAGACAAVNHLSQDE